MIQKIGKMLPVSCGAGDPYLDEGARIPCCLAVVLLSLCINHPPFSVPVYKVRVSLYASPLPLIRSLYTYYGRIFWSSQIQAQIFCISAPILTKRSVGPDVELPGLAREHHSAFVVPVVFCRCKVIALPIDLLAAGQHLAFLVEVIQAFIND